MEYDLNALKERSLSTGLFADEQAYLAALTQSPQVRSIFIDPDGTLPLWLGVVVRAETGVIYATQCAGVATEQRLVQGFYVPLGGSKYDVDAGYIELASFNDVFHDHGACHWNWTGTALPKERLNTLSRLVEEISYWSSSAECRDHKYQLRLDRSRISEIAEAWIPVHTPDGPGVLLYDNCD